MIIPSYLKPVREFLLTNGWPRFFNDRLFCFRMRWGHVAPDLVGSEVGNVDEVLKKILVILDKYMLVKLNILLHP